MAVTAIAALPSLLLHVACLGGPYAQCSSRLVLYLSAGKEQKAIQTLGKNPSAAFNSNFVGGNTLLHLAAKSNAREVLQILIQAYSQGSASADAGAAAPSIAQAPPGIGSHRATPEAGNGNHVAAALVAAASHEAWENSMSGGTGSGSGSSSARSTQGSVPWLDRSNHRGQTALIMACKHDHVDAVRLLLHAGANPWLVDRHGRTALHYAVWRCRQAACVEAVLERAVVTAAQRPADMAPGVRCLADMPDRFGYTPLHYAMAAGRLGALGAMLRSGANVSARSGGAGDDDDWIRMRRGSTVLHIAARSQFLAGAQAVLRFWYEHQRLLGVPDPRRTADGGGIRPCELAAWLGFDQMAKLLAPWVPLQVLFGDRSAGRAGTAAACPSLKSLAATALQAVLLTQIAALEQQAQPAALQPDGPSAAGGDGDGSHRPATLRQPPRRASTEGVLVPWSAGGAHGTVSQGAADALPDAVAAVAAAGPGSHGATAAEAPDRVLLGRVATALESVQHTSVVLARRLHWRLARLQAEQRLGARLLSARRRQAAVVAAAADTRSWHGCSALSTGAHTSAGVLASPRRDGSRSPAPEAVGDGGGAAAGSAAGGGGLPTGYTSVPESMHGRSDAFQALFGMLPPAAAAAATSAGPGWRLAAAEAGQSNPLFAHGYESFPAAVTAVQPHSAVRPNTAASPVLPGAHHTLEHNRSRVASRCPSATAPAQHAAEAAAAAHAHAHVPTGRASVSGASCAEPDHQCGICFEAMASLRVTPCGHTLCGGCARGVSQMVPGVPPACPFCRGLVAGFDLSTAMAPAAV